MSAALIFLTVAILAPMASVVVVGLLVLLGDRRPSESVVARVVGTGLVASVVGGLLVAAAFAGVAGPRLHGDVEFGASTASR
jgi:hypothetical protein